MQCPNCNNEINGNENYCPYCGHKLGNACPNCHLPISSNDKFCPHCGQPLGQKIDNGYYEPIHYHTDYEENHTNYSEVPENRTKVKWKPIIIGLIILALLTGGSLIYLASQESTDDLTTDNTQSISVKENNDYSTYVGNVNYEGLAYFDGTTIYMTNEKGYLVTVDKDYSNSQVLLEESVSYITPYKDYIYFADENNYLSRVDKDGKNKKILVKDAVYYIVLKGDLLYYQLDSDQESLYAYDIKTSKATKVNDCHSYCPNITDDAIYYTSTDGIYVMDLNGKNDKRIIEGKVYSLLYESQNLYYVDSNGVLNVYHTEDGSKEEILSNTGAFNKKGDIIYAYTARGVISYDLSTKESKTLYSGSIDSMQVIGNTLLINANQSWLAIDDNGSILEIFSEDSENFV